MLPHSYTVDSQSKSQDLASTILSASSPSQISAACTSILSFLHHLSPDQSRWFFSITFPTLIAKLFGFDESSSPPPSSSSSSSSSSPSKPVSFNGWIDTVSTSNDPELAGKLFALLSPNSTLLSLISAVDRLSLVKYVFPIERLPEWTRFMLSNERDCRVLSDLCPLFKNRIKEDQIKGLSFQIQLNVFEYYVFWFAFYPVCRGVSGNVDNISVRKSKRFRLENWASSIKGFSSAKRGSEQKVECNLYIRLLYAYLRAFVPVYDLNAHQPYRSSLLHYPSGYDGSVLQQAEFVVNTLIQFWLVDNDFSPVPVNVCKSFGASLPFRSVLGEIPPASGLGEVVKLFVKYLNLSSVEVAKGYNQMLSSGSVDVVKSREVTSVSPCVSSVGSWNLLIQRPQYRFILRTFLFCPVETSIKNMSQIFSLWISYMEPWKISSEDFVELDALVDRSAENERKEYSKLEACEYSSSWQGYVLSNYLFYSSLVMHFIGFAHKFLHADAEVIVDMVVKLQASTNGAFVERYILSDSFIETRSGIGKCFDGQLSNKRCCLLILIPANRHTINPMVSYYYEVTLCIKQYEVINILTSTRQLTQLIKDVDTLFHSKQVGVGKSTLHSLYRFIPSIREQLQDWENGLCESDADGSFLHENWNRDLRLFSDGEDGGQQLLQLFILRAESELQATSGDNLAHNLQCVDTLKTQVSCLFGGNIVKPMSESPEVRQRHQSRDEMFKPRKLGNNTMADIKYKGDWMKRPISDDEVAWLAKLLLSLSAWMNERLGLNQVTTSCQVKPTWSYVELSGDEALNNVYGPMETAKMVLYSIGCWLLMAGSVIVDQMRKHGVRVNLRGLASKKVVMVLLVSAVFSLLKNAFGLLHRL